MSTQVLKRLNELAVLARIEQGKFIWDQNPQVFQNYDGALRNAAPFLFKIAMCLHTALEGGYFSGNDSIEGWARTVLDNLEEVTVP